MVLVYLDSTVQYSTVQYSTGVGVPAGVELPVGAGHQVPVWRPAGAQAGVVHTSVLGVAPDITMHNGRVL